MSYARIGVVGGGAWGTALTQLAARAGRRVVVWEREARAVAAINGERENTVWLPGVRLHPAIRATGDMAEACAADTVLLAVPSRHVRAASAWMAESLAPATPVACCAKGLEDGTGRLMSEVLAETLPGRPVGCLSGPTFAAEAARGAPTAAALAMPEGAAAESLARALESAAFRLDPTDDVVGAEVGGAVKNPVAVACGFAAGRGLGENARADLVARGLAEAARFAVALGGRAETLAGLAGLGDLVLTCSSAQSRNFRFGEALGRGATAAEALAAAGGLVEGRGAARAIARRAAREGVELPICAAVDAAANAGAGPEETLDALFAARPAPPGA